MSQLKTSKHDDFVEWRFKGLYVMGVMGKCDIPLDKWSQICNTHQLEFAPVKEERYRDFLAAFSVQTPLDITIAQYSRGSEETSIVVYGCEENISREIVGGIIRNSGLIASIPSSAFVSQLSMEIRNVNIGTYLQLEEVARLTQRPIERVFGQAHYANFLNLYKGLPDEEAFRLAEIKFK